MRIGPLMLSVSAEAFTNVVKGHYRRAGGPNSTATHGNGPRDVELVQEKM